MLTTNDRGGANISSQHNFGNNRMLKELRIMLEYRIKIYAVLNDVKFLYSLSYIKSYCSCIGWCIAITCMNQFNCFSVVYFGN